MGGRSVQRLRTRFDGGDLELRRIGRRDLSPAHWRDKHTDGDRPGESHQAHDCKRGFAWAAQLLRDSARDDRTKTLFHIRSRNSGNTWQWGYPVEAADIED